MSASIWREPTRATMTSREATAFERMVAQEQKDKIARTTMRIPITIYKEMADRPEAFGFESEQLRKELARAVERRKLAVKKREIGGLSGQWRNGSTEGTASAAGGRHSKNGGESRQKRLERQRDARVAAGKEETDPNDFGWGPKFQIVSKAEAQEVYTACEKVITYWRLEAKINRSAPHIAAEYDTKLSTTNRAMIAFRDNVLMHWMAEPGEGIIATRSRVTLWCSDIRRECERDLSLFQPDSNYVPMRVSRRVAEMAFMWTSSGMNGGEYIMPHPDMPANVWDRIMESDRESGMSKNGPLIQVNTSEIKVLHAKALDVLRSLNPFWCMRSFNGFVCYGFHERGKGTLRDSEEHDHNDFLAWDKLREDCQTLCPELDPELSGKEGITIAEASRLRWPDLRSTPT